MKSVLGALGVLLLTVVPLFSLYLTFYGHFMLYSQVLHSNCSVLSKLAHLMMGLPCGR